MSRNPLLYIYISVHMTLEFEAYFSGIARLFLPLASLWKASFKALTTIHLPYLHLDTSYIREHIDLSYISHLDTSILLHTVTYIYISCF